MRKTVCIIISIGTVLGLVFYFSTKLVTTRKYVEDENEVVMRDIMEGKSTKGRDTVSRSSGEVFGNRDSSSLVLKQREKLGEAPQITADTLKTLDRVLAVQLGRRVAVNKTHAITVDKDAEKSDVIRFEVREGDYSFNGNRAEIKLSPSNAEHYEFQFRVVKYRYQGDWFSICDWHQQADISQRRRKKGKDLVPPLSIHLVHDKIVFMNRANSEKNNLQKVRVFEGPLVDGWNKVSVDVIWDDSNNGKLLIKLNDSGTQLENITTTYDQTSPLFFKLGIYRNAKYVGTSVVEFKDVQVDGKRILPDFSKRATGENEVDRINIGEK